MHDLDRQQLELARANSGASVLSEAQELELAAELLGVSSEEELGKWLGDVARRAAPVVTAAQRAAGKAYVGNSAVVDKVGRFVKTVGPPLSAAAGLASGLPPDVALHRANQLPGTVDTVASWLQNRMQQWSTLELEGLSAEDRELEYARRYTRFAHRALRNAWLAPRRMPVGRAAHIAVGHAARHDLPGLVPHITQIFHIGANELSTTGAGRWRRSRNAIVIDLG